MKKIFSLVCLGILMVTLAFAENQDTNSIMNQLNAELETAAVFTPQELKPIENPIKNMLTKGATKEDLKTLLLGLANKGVKGDNLKTTINAMNDLVNSGVHPKEAGNVVSRAAHQAQAQGLKGKELAAKVHEAIRQRKAEHERFKKEKRQQREKHKGKNK